MRLDERSVLLTNDWGEFKIISPDLFERLIHKQLDMTLTEYFDLRSKYFVSDSRSSNHLRVMASKYKTKKSFLEGFTKLHIFVVTLRCDHSCPYCQVSRQSEDKMKYDMTLDMAHKAVDLMLRGPASAITCEFQGGEALLNFPMVQEIVRYAKERNQSRGKFIDFVICTNLSYLTDAHLEFFREHKIKVSTSLDGPAFLHDGNRPCSRGSSHAFVEQNLRRAQEALGVENVAALMTTTKESLAYPRQIVDEYIRLNLGSIFLRSLSPYGFATKTMKAIGYSSEEFFEFYKDALGYIIEINRGGHTFVEGYTTLILTKILTPFATNYVDLQSPSGAGFSAVAYNYDGEVYASDEARMLAEMNDTSFRLGNVLDNSYEQIFFGERMQAIAAASCNEALAGCADCAFQPYCGADPVYHYATQGDMFGNRATSGFCRKNMAIIRHIFELFRQGNLETEEIFWSWINQANREEMKLPSPPWLSN
jgi:His-Xaa-Ser system radical SAM maturase HxsB